MSPSGLGRGSAFGAVTIVNATATGIGCSLAVQGGATATWAPAAAPSFAAHPPADDRLARAVAAACTDLAPGPAAVTVRCDAPPARGLKTSSSVAAALVRAAAASAGRALPDDEVERRAVAACRAAGVTLTGAYDDQAATVRGGCHVTDNRASRILASPRVPPWAVALWVPDAAIPKDAAARADLAGAVPGARHAAGLALAGRVAEAMTANGRAFHDAYAAAGLPVDDRPTQAALAAGAIGAGLSGTGPAVAALFERPAPLPVVRGGAWRWTVAIPAAPRRPLEAPA